MISTASKNTTIYLANKNYFVSPASENNNINFLFIALIAFLAALQFGLAAYGFIDKIDFLIPSDSTGYELQGRLVYNAYRQQGVPGIFDVDLKGFHDGYGVLNGLFYIISGVPDQRIMAFVNIGLSFATLLFLYKLMVLYRVPNSLMNITFFLFAVNPERILFSLMNLKEVSILFIIIMFFYFIEKRKTILAICFLFFMMWFRYYLVPMLIIYAYFAYKKEGVKQSLAFKLIFIISIISGFGGLILLTMNPTALFKFNPQLYIQHMAKFQAYQGVKSWFSPMDISTYIYLPVAMARVMVSPLPWKATGVYEYFSWYYMLNIFVGFPLFCYGVFLARKKLKFIFKSRHEVYKAIIIFLTIIVFFYASVPQLAAMRHRYLILPFYIFFQAIGLLYFNPGKRNQASLKKTGRGITI